MGIAPYGRLFSGGEQASGYCLSNLEGWPGTFNYDVV